MTCLNRKIHVREEMECSAKSLTSPTTLTASAVGAPACELDHDWSAQHPRRPPGTEKLHHLAKRTPAGVLHVHAPCPRSFRATL